MTLTLEQTVGQLLWCGWGDPPGPDSRRCGEHARVLAEELGVGGIALFSRNLGEPAEIAGLVRELRERSALPPLIGIDQEGGRVSRLPLPGMVFPGNMALGVLDDLELTREVARVIGAQLAALGIDVDFAPSVDVNNNPANPIIGVRSFGDDPALVARHGVAAVQGFRDVGVLPVIKHFPGHGDTGKDSHLELPVQPAGRERLDAVELLPFREAIAAGAPAVMTTHIMFPELDPELPSTLSPAILTGLLRGELGFDGLIVTDCLEMKGITDHWGPEEAAVLALQAGADMLLVCHTLETQRRMHRAVCEAVRQGRLSHARLAESTARVQRARELTSPIRQGQPLPERAGTFEFRQLEAHVADATLAMVGGAVPTPFDAALPVLVAGERTAARDLAIALCANGFEARAGAATEPSPVGAPQLVWVVQPTDPFPDGRPTIEVYGLLERHPHAVVVSVREPYPLAHYPPGVARLAAWGALPAQFAAVARWLARPRAVLELKLSPP